VNGNHASKTNTNHNMKTSIPILLALTAGCGVLAPQRVPAQAVKTVYFVRHAESTTALFQQGHEGNAWVPDCKPFMNEGVLEECCTEVLTPLGDMRAALLAKWFADKSLLTSITHVFATHKERSLQTVRPIAHAAQLDRDINGDGVPDGTDADKNPGDGVQQLPAYVDECAPGYEVAHNFYLLTVDALRAAPSGSAAVVAGHSLSIYPIMQALGVDTSSPSRFPKTPTGAVRGFNNVWVITLDANNVGTLAKHLQLDFAFVEKVSP
jgi:broad specificity phosphatase PhoE